MNAISVGVNAIVILCQLVALILTCLALGGSSWIQNVEGEGDYFTRASSMSYVGGATSLFDGRIHSMGLWRFYNEPGRSYPLILRDTEMTAGAIMYILSLVGGAACIVLISYQLIGIKANSTAMSFSVFWVTFFQGAILLAANIVLVEYWKSTFEYETLSHSHHVAWVAFAFSALAVFLCIVKVYVTMTEDDEDMEVHSTVRSRVMSPAGGSSYHAATNEYHRPSSQYEMRAAAAPEYDMRPSPPKHYTPS